MGGVVEDDVGIAEATMRVRDGLDIVGGPVSGEVGVPFVVECRASLGGPFGVGVGSKGGDRADPGFLD